MEENNVCGIPQSMLWQDFKRAMPLIFSHIYLVSVEQLHAQNEISLNKKSRDERPSYTSIIRSTAKATSTKRIESFWKNYWLRPYRETKRDPKCYAESYLY